MELGLKEGIFIRQTAKDLLEYQKEILESNPKDKNDFLNGIDFEEYYDYIIHEIKEGIKKSNGKKSRFRFYTPKREKVGSYSTEEKEDKLVMTFLRNHLRNNGFYVKMRYSALFEEYFLDVRLEPNFLEKSIEKIKATFYKR